MHWVYYFGRFLARMALFFLSNWQVRGKENIPNQGALLIAANHLHLADPPIVAVSVGIKAIIMAKEELFHHWFSRFVVENFGSFPVRRGGLDRKAISQAKELVKPIKNPATATPVTPSSTITRAPTRSASRPAGS